MNSEIKTVIEHVKKLLSRGDRTKNPHEGEVKTALAMAHNLMNKHNLKMSDIDLESTDVIETSALSKYSFSLWEQALVSIVAKVCGVEQFTTVSINMWGKRQTHVTFVGFPEDVELSCEMYKIIRLTLMGMGNVYVLTNDFNYLLSERSKHRDRRSYIYGIVARLFDRAVEISKCNEVPSVDNTRVNAIVIRKDVKVKAFLNEKHPNLSYNTLKQSDIDVVPFCSGYKDGDNVAFGNNKVVGC